MRRLGVLGVTALLVTGACTGGDDATRTTETAVSSTTTAAVAPQPTATTLARPTVDLTERPQIWFGPLPPLGPNEFGEIRTGPEFYDLFRPGADWEEAAGNVHVFHFFGEWAAWRSTEAELAAVVADLNRRGIAIGYEGGPLTPVEGCTESIEGFAGAREGRVIVNRIAAAGGRVVSMSLEHAFDALGELSEECSMTLAEGAADIAGYVDVVRAVFPDVEFGLIETGALDVATISAYLDAYHEALGEYPAYLALDFSADDPSWPQSALAIQEHVQGRGIEFAIFYLGLEHDRSDAEWLDNLRREVVEYEVVYGGRPDRPIFESWHRFPQTLLPDWDPAAFTQVLRWYDRERTSMSLEVGESEAGLVVSGKLEGRSSVPLGGETVTLRARAASGLGFAQDYVVTGVVPDDAVVADVGWRINEESHHDDRPADLVIEGFAYHEAGGPNLIRNPSFASGLSGWFVWGDGTQRLRAGGLHITAAPGQVASANSERFAVTPGAPFEMTITARVSPESDGSGHFALIFHGEDGEIRRLREHIRPSRTVIGEAVTSFGGRFEFAAETPVEPVVFEAWYDGSASHWPALAAVEPG